MGLCIETSDAIEQVLATFERTEILNVFEERRYRVEVYRSVTDVLVYTADITWSQNCPKCEKLHIWQGMGGTFELMHCSQHGNAKIDMYRCEECGEKVKPPFHIDVRKINGTIQAKGWFSWKGDKPSPRAGERIGLDTYNLPVSRNAVILSLRSFGKMHIVEFDTK